MTDVKTHVVQRRNARGGRSAEEHLVAALRCLYQRAVDDGLALVVNSDRSCSNKPAGSTGGARLSRDMRTSPGWFRCQSSGPLARGHEHPGARSCRVSRCRRSVIEQALKNPPRLPEPDWPSPIRTNGWWQAKYWRRRSGTVRTTSACCYHSSPVTCRRPRWPVSAGSPRWRRRRTGSHGNCTAIDGTVQTTLPAGTALAPVDLKVCFLRPVSPDGRDLLARGTVIHRGRSMAIAISEVLNADGKKAAVATVSTVILPGRPATVTTELTLPQLDESEDDEERR